MLAADLSRNYQNTWNKSLICQEVSYYRRLPRSKPRNLIFRKYWPRWIPLKSKVPRTPRLEDFTWGAWGTMKVARARFISPCTSRDLVQSPINVRHNPCNTSGSVPQIHNLREFQGKRSGRAAGIYLNFQRKNTPKASSTR